MTLPEQSPERPVVELVISIGDSLAKFIEANGLDQRHGKSTLNLLQPSRMRDFDDSIPSHYIVARAGSSGATDPGGVAVLMDAPSCTLRLPAGRQLKIGHIGGLVDEIELIAPLQSLNWDAMQAAVTALIAELDGAGWVRTRDTYGPDRPINEILTPEDFANKVDGSWARVGSWAACDQPDVKAWVQVLHYNALSSATMTPPAVLGRPLPDDAPDTFLLLIRIQAEFDSPLEREMTRLRNARRQEVTGSAETPLPLALWIEDPDWRPAGWSSALLP